MSGPEGRAKASELLLIQPNGIFPAKRKE